MRYLILILSVVLSMAVQAQSLTVNAPRAVEVGQQFQVQYTLDARGKGFQSPDFKDFDYLNGPARGSSNSRVFANGKWTNNRKESYTYYLRASKEGTFTIGPASVEVKGKTIKSKSIRIQVVRGAQKQATPQNSGEAPKADIFVRSFISKSEAYEGEGLVCTIKLFTKNEFGLRGIKEPHFTGFHRETIEVKNQQGQQEAYNNQVYHAQVLAKYILYPTQSGELEIPPAEVDVIVRTYRTRKARNRHERIFYGNTIREAVDKELKLKSPSRKLTVKTLPAQGKPASFNGFVGELDLQSDISFTEIEVDKAINLNYTLKGLGNIDLLTLPEPVLPPDFDVFDPEMSQNSKAGERGVSGSKSFKYILIPRTDGTFEIPALEFAYFDSEEQSYKVLTSEAYTVKVGDGVNDDAPQQTGSYAEGKEVHYVDRDIRYLHANLDLPEVDKKHLMQTWFTTVYFIGAPLLLIAFIVWRKKQQKDQQDVQLMRYKKANKLARKHLRNAHTMLKAQQQEDFYIEISKVLWGYLSAKFSIARSDLSIAEIVEQLQSKALDASSISDIRKVLEQCEFARFAPEEDKRSQMQLIYDESLQIISKIEKGIK